MPTDRVYTKSQEMIVDFVFDEAVANVFPDMVRRSVPGYDVIIPMIGLLAEQYAQPDSHLYDLGCSLGAVTLSMSRRITQPGCRIIAIDNSEAMVAHCRENIAVDKQAVPVDIICANIQEIDLHKASVVVMNFTLQFIVPELRHKVLTSIYQALLPGGVLIISEKICFSEQHLQQLHTRLHEAFKKANGYSELEISQKRTALENILIPETIEQHSLRLREAGFSSCNTWFQCFNFASLIAIK